ncbi:hypothetical protein ACN5SO_004551 [Vibrio parahaemolyticus]
MPNKQFKSDSPRLAFLVWVKFSDYGGLIELCGSVVHTLIGRYFRNGSLRLNVRGCSLRVKVAG